MSISTAKETIKQANVAALRIARDVDWLEHVIATYQTQMIERLIEESGLSLRSFAKLVGTSASTVSHLKRNKQPMTVARYARWLKKVRES